MCASGCITGLVIERGGGLTQVVPCHEGFTLLQAATKLDINGLDFANHMMALLDYDAPTSENVSEEQELSQDMKKQICLVILDFKAEMEDGIEPKEHTLPYININLGGSCTRMRA